MDMQGENLHDSEHIDRNFVALDRRNLACNANFVDAVGRIFEEFQED
jgi:hypothetical protein